MHNFRPTFSYNIGLWFWGDCKVRLLSTKFWTCVPNYKSFGWSVKECITYQIIYHFWCREWPLNFNRDLWPWPITLEVCNKKYNFMHHQCAKSEYNTSYINESMFNCLKFHACHRYSRWARHILDPNFTNTWKRVEVFTLTKFHDDCIFFNFRNLVFPVVFFIQVKIVSLLKHCILGIYTGVKFKIVWGAGLVLD